MSDYRVLDLFCGLGGFSQAFAASDRWSVTTVDIEARFEPDRVADVFELHPSDFNQQFDVVLASPPCQYLSTAGNHDRWDHMEKSPADDTAADAVALFFHALGVIKGLDPTYWYVENPRASRIQWFYRRPDEWVTYCQYGKSYQKPTGLWGEFAPMTFERCRSGASCHTSNGADDGTSAVQSMPSDTGVRSKVPAELSAAIRDACEAALDGDVAEQTTLGEVHA